MKIIKYSILFLISFLLWSCNKDSDPNPINCEISYKISAISLNIGDHLIISDFNLTPILPQSGITINKVEYFLGNKKIKSNDIPLYDLNYEIPDMAEGTYLLQIDVHLSAEGYDKTTIWLKQNIEIKEPLINEEI